MNNPLWKIWRLPQLGNIIVKKSILAMGAIFSMLAVVTTFLPIEDIILLDELSNNRVNIDEHIYMPVIASGYANTDMNKSIQELTHMMTELLKFNAPAIQNPIHVVVYEKDQKDVSIFV